MMRGAWFLNRDWGGSFSIRQKDVEGGEWLLAFVHKEEHGEFIAGVVNAFRTGDLSGVPPLVREQRWVCRRGLGDRVEIREEHQIEPAWPIASFNKRGDAALLVDAMRWLEARRAVSQP